MKWEFWVALGAIAWVVINFMVMKWLMRRELHRLVCDGPCYDFCACPHCWNGWSRIPFYRRLWDHLKWRWHYATTGEWL